MGQRWADRDEKPDRMLVSTAARAQETARILVSQIGFPAHRLELRDDMYGAGTDRLLSILEEVEAQTLHVALVCHNPGISDLVGWLCRDRGAGMPTCGIASIELADVGGWELSSGCGTLLNLDHPGRPGLSNASS